MKTNKSTKRALLLSVCSIVLCFVMLIGTTFAWFTDTASTAVNTIQSGKLDIDIVDKEGTNSLDGKTLYFRNANNGTDILWEPGATFHLDQFQLVNKGNLALKYKLTVNGVEGDTELLDAIDFTVKIGEAEATKLEGWEGVLLPKGATPIDAEKEAVETTGLITISGHMKKEAGNEYQGKTLTGLGIKVVATQYTYEYDSESNTYDADAAASEFSQNVSVNGKPYDSIQAAYDDIKPVVEAYFGLGEEAFSASDTEKVAKFDELFPDGKVIWTIYGSQKLTDPKMLSFGRSASDFGARIWKQIEVVAGNSTAALDLSATNGTFSLPYNWWGETVENVKLTFKGITFDGIKSIPSNWAEPNQDTPYTFEDCTFNGSLYGYHDYNVNLIFKNCEFNAPANTKYGIFLQSTTGISGKVTIDGCTFNNYTRGVNLQRPGTDFIFTNNVIKSNCSEADRGAIQLTDGKSFVVNGNTVDVNAGNAFWFHNAATNADVTYTINDNDIKAPYIGYSGVTAFDVNTKITSSGNKFNSTDVTKCMKKDATVAEATNLTAIK